MPRLITAAIATALPTDGVPNEIVYIPEGEHQLTPFVDGKPQRIQVSLPAARGAAIAAKFQSDLEARQSLNVRPWTDFDHERKKSSGNPTGFRYEPGRGLIMSMDWSKGGREALEGKDFSYFSPSFLLADDGTPDGLDIRGPVGSLVNEPAFREIPRIAAADASGQQDQPEATPTMSKLIFAALAISAAAENAEQEAVKAIEKMKADKKSVDAELATVKTERDDLRQKLDAAEATAAAERKTRAKSLVDAAIADGRIAAKDEATATKFREKIEAGDTFAEECLAMLPKKNEGLDKPIIHGKRGEEGGKDGEHEFQTEARKLVTAKQADSIEAAQAQLAEERPELYEAYCESIGLA